MKISHHLGIDQTGAVSSKGIPKPLPMCILSGSEVQLVYLKHFVKTSFLEHLSQKQLSASRILVDCVFGLPSPFVWREVFKSTLEQSGFGLKVASMFFNKIGQGKVYYREIDRICGAQSVFLEKPYQKNIQSGTFRIWKELAGDDEWYRFPLISSETQNSGVAVYEGYPSLAWKLLFDVKKREPQNLSKLIRDVFPQIQWTRQHSMLIKKDSNLADAVVLALLSRFHRCTSSPHPEGWIYR